MGAVNNEGARMTVLRHHERLETRAMVYAGQTFEATAQEVAIYRARLSHLAAPVEDAEPTLGVGTAEPTDSAADAPAEVEPDAPKRRRRRKRASE